MSFWSLRSLAQCTSKALPSVLTVSLVTALPMPAVQAQARAEAAAPSAYDRALNAYLEADFSSARRLLDEGIEAPSTSLHELAASYALLAVLLETEGAPSAGVDARIDFAVSIERSVALPPGVSRAFEQRFNAVRAARTADAPSIQLERPSPPSAVAQLINAPEGLVSELQLTCVAQESVSGVGSLEARVEAPSAIQSCTAQAVDAQGRVLFQAEQEFGIDLGLAQQIAAPQDDTLWIVLGIVGGALVIGGAITIGILASPRDAMLGAPTVTGWPR